MTPSRLALAAAAALSLNLLAALPAQAQATPAASAAQPANPDRSFVMQAALGGLAEVRLGELAQRQGGSDAVEQFGAQMVQDHGKANEELMRIAKSKGLQPPTQLDNKHAALHDRLQKLSGAEFDREYLRAMLDAHRKDVALFEQQARDGRDAELKAFAQKTLPTLKQHLSHVQGLVGKS